jgi:hypothetical protein
LVASITVSPFAWSLLFRRADDFSGPVTVSRPRPVRVENKILYLYLDAADTMSFQLVTSCSFIYFMSYDVTPFYEAKNFQLAV